MKRLKVAIVYPIPFGEEGSYGGGERYAWELARAMSLVAETVFVTIGQKRYSRQLGRLQVEMHPWITLARGIRINPLALGFLRSLAGVDVIHCLSYSTLVTDLCVLFARTTGKRVFITDVGGGGDVSLKYWVDVASFSNGLLLLSEFAGRSFPACPATRHVIYGGVDIQRFRPGNGEPTGKVLFVGRLLPHKGVNYLIEALDPHTPLVVVGRPYHQAYFQYLQELAKGKDVTFVTDANDQRIIAEYQSSTVAVLPSVYNDVYGNHCAVPELLGLTLLEAMACGTPVICTSVGSMPEIVEHGVTGIVVPPNDIRSLSEAIARFTEDPVRARAMGRASHARVQHLFTWTGTAARCLQAYEGGAA